MRQVTQKSDRHATEIRRISDRNRSAIRRFEPEMIEHFVNGYYRLLQVLLTLLMTALIVPVTMQILSRYTGMIPRYIWTEEIARFCFIWIVMIGAMIAVRDGTHFDVDVLPKGSHKVEADMRSFLRHCNAPDSP